MIPAIGDNFRFIPSAYISGDNGTDAARARIENAKVEGTVSGINWAHGWYRVTYKPRFDREQHECFHFYP